MTTTTMTTANTTDMRLFPTKRNIEKEIGLLVEHAEKLPRGSVITYKEIEAITSISRSAKRDAGVWVRLIARWKAAMRNPEHGGVAWDNRPTVGYMSLTVEQQLTEKVDRVLGSAMKRNKLAAECLAGVHDEDLTEDQKAYRAGRLGHCTELSAKVKEHKAIATGWLANPQTLPRATAKAIK